MRLAAAGTAVIDLGPDFRLRDPADYPRWYGFEHPRPDLLDDRGLRAPGAPSGGARARWSMPRSRSSARPAATRRRRSSRSLRWRAPGSSATSWSMPRAASRAPAARRKAELDVRRGQRERQGLRRRRPSPRRRDRAGACRDRRSRPGSTSSANPGIVARRLPPPPHPDDPRHPVGLPRPPDPAGQPGRARRAVRSGLRGRAVRRRSSADATGHQARRRAATRSASTSASTSGPVGSSPSASRTTSSRAPPARRSRRSTSSTACPRRPASTSSRSRHDHHLGTSPSRRPRRTSHRSSDAPPSRPASRRAGWRPGSRPRAGRTSPSCVTTTGPAAVAAVFTPNTFAAAPVRLSQAHLAATSGDPRGGFGWAEAVISTSGSANAATGAAGDADQAEIAADARGGDRRRGRADAPSLDRDHRDAAAARQGDGRAGGARPDARGDRRRAARRGRRAAHHRFEDQDARPRPSSCPAPTGGSAARITRQRHRQGRRDDPPADGDDAVGRADRRDGRARGPVGPAPAGRGADLGPALGRWRHEHERHRLRPGVGGGGRRAGRGRFSCGGRPRRRRSRRSRATWRASRPPTARARPR